MCRCSERAGLIARAASHVVDGQFADAGATLRRVAETYALDWRDGRDAASSRLAAARARLTRR